MLIDYNAAVEVDNNILVLTDGDWLLCQNILCEEG
jgi:hypothetical protein